MSTSKIDKISLNTYIYFSFFILYVEVVMQTTQLIGSYRWLTTYPMFETLTFLFLVSVVAMFYIRDVFEGLAYNTSRCALWGSLAILGIIAIGIDAIRTGTIPPFLVSDTFHIGAAALSVVFTGVIIRKYLKKEDGVRETVADHYRNWILLPGYTYLCLTLIPLISVQINKLDDLGLFVAILVLGAIWTMTGYEDDGRGRLDQQRCLQNRGLELPLRTK